MSGRALLAFFVALATVLVAGCAPGGGAGAVREAGSSWPSGNATTVAARYDYGRPDVVTTAPATRGFAAFRDYDSTARLPGRNTVDALGSAAEDVTAGGTRLFRVTGPNETADIQASGAYRLAKGRVGKSFYPTEEQAVNLARMYNESGIGGPYTLTSGVFSPDLMAELEPFSPVGEGQAYFARGQDRLDRIFGVQIHGPVP